ncbi:MAG: beta strand repeat-containing protein [Phycisphaerae bacterium]
MASRSHRCILAMATAVVLAAGMNSARSDTGITDDNYIGWNTTWSDPTAWSKGMPPTFMDNVLILPTVYGGTNTLTLDTSAQVNNVILGANGGGTATLALQGGPLSANSISILSSGRITGMGILQGAINNAGVITTSDGINFFFSGTSANAGTMIATGASSLQLNGSGNNAMLDNTGGTIAATGNLTNNSISVSNLTIVGGNLTASGSNSTVWVTGTSSLAGVTISGAFRSIASLSLQDVTFASGNYTQGSTVSLAGTIVNNGNWTSSGGPTSIDSPVAINGNGTVTLMNVTWGSTNPAASLSIGAGQTITGSGAIGYSALKNAGTIRANGTSALTLVGAYGGTLTNTGTLSAINGNTLSLAGSNTTIYNYGGTISATGAGSGNIPSTVDIGQVNLLGGQLSTDAGGRIFISGQAVLTDLTISGNLLANGAATFNNVAFNGQVTQFVTSILNGTITNNANWTANSSLQVIGAVSLAGNGTLTLNNSGITATTVASLTIGAGQTVAGSGTIAAGPLVNSGTLRANGSSPLSINLYNSSNSSLPVLINNGTIQAANATLSINGGFNSLVYNSGGLLSATGSAGNLALSCLTINGGQLATDNLAQVSLNSVTLANVTATGNFVGNSCVSLQNVTLAGNYTQPFGTTTLAGINTLNGNATINQVALGSPVTINGNGTVTLTGGLINSNSTASLTLSAGMTLTGNGTIPSYIPVTNAGTLLATGQAVFHVNTGLFTNGGAISATGGGDVEFVGSSGVLNNYGGTISATGAASPQGPASLVNISNYAVSGGQIVTDALGSIHVAGSTTLNDVQVNGNVLITGFGSFTDVTLAGNITQSSSFTLAGAITNNANWNVTSGFGGNIAGKVLLGGNGTLTLSGTSIQSTSSSASLTIGAAQTLLGKGQISVGTNLALANLGTINANTSGSFNITINSNGNMSVPSMINAGTLAASNGGNLSINGSGVNSIFLLNSGGTISATGSNGGFHSNASIYGLTLYGGQIVTDGVDAITLNSVALQNVQVSGRIVLADSGSMLNTTLSGNITSNGGVSTTLYGGITNNALWSVNGGAILFSGSQTLAGNGTIALLGGTLNSNLSVLTLTLPATQSIKGYGNIGSNAYGLGINNAGLIAAMPKPAGNITSFSPLNLNLPANVLSINSGNLSALGGSTLKLAGNFGSMLDNTGGTISATGAASGNSLYSQVNISNLAITGGTLLTDSDGSIHFQGGVNLAGLNASGNLVANSGNLGLRNVTLGGNLTQFGGTSTVFTGGVTNNANWTLSGGSSLAVAGAQTIKGTGNLFLNGASIGTAVGAGMPNFSVLTNAGGSVIQGTGTIGDLNMAAIFNFGLIDANSTSPQALNFAAPLTNNGDLSVEPFCFMTINAPFNAGSGIIHNNGTLTINGPVTGPINQVGNGTLIINPAINTMAASSLGNALVLFNASGNAISTATGNATLIVAAGTADAPGLVSDGLKLNTLTVNGAVEIRPNGSSSGTSTLQHLILAGNPGGWTGALDLTNNDLVVEITSGSTLSVLLDQVAFGAASAGGPAARAGIFTSLTGMGIAVIDNSSLPTPLTSFGGVPVDANSVLLAGAFLGDSNLDGHVDLSDLSVVLNHFGQSTGSWLAGNFDHAPTVDLTDLSCVLNNFGRAASMVGVSTAEAGAVPAPEPASLLALAAAPLFLLRRRRESGCKSGI